MIAGGGAGEDVLGWGRGGGAGERGPVIKYYMKVCRLRFIHICEDMSTYF